MSFHSDGIASKAPKSGTLVQILILFEINSTFNTYEKLPKNCDGKISFRNKYWELKIMFVCLLALVIHLVTIKSKLE